MSTPSQFLFNKAQREVISRILGNAKGRANNSNGTKGKTVEFSLSREWVEDLLIQQDHICPRTGIKYNYDTYKSWHKRSGHPSRPSINRLNPNKGYTEDNCEIVCNYYNTMLSSWNRTEVFDHVVGSAKEFIADKGTWWQRLLAKFL